MVTRFQPCLQLELNEEQYAEIVELSKDWALMHGGSLRSRTNYSEDSLIFAPFTLLPSTIPRTEYERAVALQPLLNELIHKVAHDYDFLKDALQNTIKGDEFTGKLFKIYETVKNEGFGQRLTLGMVRSDLMLDCSCSNAAHDRQASDNTPHCSWKQIEFNTIATAFSWMGTVSGLIHRFVLQELGHPEMLINLPENKAVEGMNDGIMEAWNIFGDKTGIIMFIVETVRTINICDHRVHEFKLKELNPNIKIIRRTLTQVGDSAKLGANKELLIGGSTVAVVYYRAGHEPDDYLTDKEWDARLLIERSNAIKCPSIHYQLAGSKKVQQVLAAPGSVERFIKDPEQVKAIRTLFTGLHSLDFNASGEEIVAKALATPENYVLKPQREGGGNNVYGEDVRTTLLAMKESEERLAWILMDRIIPPVQANYIIRPGYPIPTAPQDTDLELGIFGVIIGDEKTILTNKQVGYMVRTKLNSSHEGGVLRASGCLDSPYLV